MTAKELKAILANAPDETVIAIVNYRGWLSRGISLMENPLRMVNDNGKNVWHLFIYEDNRIEMAYGITPEKEIEDTIRYQAEKDRRAQRKAEREAKKQRLINLFKKIWTR